MGTFVAAMLAGGAATVVTHPPDVVRTRLQLRRNMAASLGAKVRMVRPFHGLSHSVYRAFLMHLSPLAMQASLPAVNVADIIRQEGAFALWSGIAPRIVRRTLQQAITWTLFERLLGRRIV